MIGEMIDMKMIDRNEKKRPMKMIASKMIAQRSSDLFCFAKMIVHFSGKGLYK